MRTTQIIRLTERERWILLNSIASRRDLLEKDIEMFEKHGYEALANSVRIEITELVRMSALLQDAGMIELDMGDVE